MVEGEGGNRSVRVEIYGQPYSIRTEGQSEHIFALAEMVDRRMAEIARQTLTVDSLKVAILAALHIAEELHQTRQKLEEIDRDIAERSTRVTAELEHFLKRHILEPVEPPRDDQNRER